MRSITVAIAILSFSVFADQSVYELIRDNKVSYYVNSTCKTFFSDPSQRKNLQSDAIKNSFVNPSQLGLNNYFYHYTNNSKPRILLLENETDRKKAERLIEKSGGYGEIFKYQMTYSGALTNAAGVGFYMAANPMSSASYGNYQIQFKVKPNTKIFNYNTNSNIYTNALSQIRSKSPAFSSCDSDIQYSVIFDENGADMVYYSTGSQWFVGFNEDIFLESSVKNISSTYQSTILKKMAQAGEFESLLHYVDIVNPKAKYQLPLATFLADYKSGKHSSISSVKEFTDEILKSIPVKSNESSYFSLLKNMDESLVSKYYSLFSSKSSKFSDVMINSEIKDANAGVLKQYTNLLNKGHKPSDSGITLKNLQYLYSKSFLSAYELSKKISSTVKFDQLYANYNKTEYQDGIGSLIIDDMLKFGKKHFLALDPYSQKQIFYYYIKYARMDKISSFYQALKATKLDMKTFYSYSTGINQNYNPDNLQNFYLEYLNDHSELASDGTVMNRFKYIASAAATPDIRFFKAAMPFAKTSLSMFNSYLDLYLLKNPSEAIAVLALAPEAKSMHDNYKRSAYLRAVNEYGVGSSTFNKFVQNVEIDIETEFKYVQKRYKIQEDKQIALYNRFLSNPKTKSKLGNVLDKNSKLYIFNAELPSTKLISNLLANERQNILKSIDATTQARSINKSISKSIVSYDYFNSYFDNFSNSQKMYYLMENYKEFLDSSITEKLVDRISFNQVIINQFINFVASYSDDNFSDLSRIVVDNKHLLFKASTESLKAYTQKLVTDYQVVDRHKDILLDDKFSVDEFVKNISMYTHLPIAFFDDIAAPKLRGAKLNKDSLKALAKFYQSNYRYNGVIKTKLWEMYFNQLKGNIKILLGSLEFKDLDAAHKLDILTKFNSSEESINELDNQIYKSKYDYDDYDYDYNIAVFESGDLSLIKQNMSRIEANYPDKNLYIDTFMNYYLNNGKPTFMKKHISDYLCRKIDGYRGLKKWYKRWDNGDERRQRASIYNDECR